jgi:hypothetical protein
LLGARDDACTDVDSWCVMQLNSSYRRADQWCPRHRNVIIQRNGLSVR